ncbi:hypothetical protein UFOVP346_40 [uncultured Caudovirales phage]|uniref:Uncharacterized protein n=1 Tax=uncultured Caudovirales phage TaxID=2100421 RepID=A0A6J5LY08_9CAUD|nr:hypothetical protein UFOVP346_40 [uncultured Caudovirales phage]
MANFIVYTLNELDQGLVLRWGSCPEEVVEAQATGTGEISVSVEDLSVFERGEDELPIREFFINPDTLEVSRVNVDQEQYDLDLLRARAISYLSDTDWYVVRQSETGKPMPDDVKIKRAEARSVL